MSEKAVCRTALATLCLFKMCAQGLILSSFFVFDFCEVAASLTARMSRPRCSTVGKASSKVMPKRQEEEGEGEGRRNINICSA